RGGSGLEQKGHSVKTQDFSVQNGVTVSRIRHDPEARSGQKFVNRRCSEALLDAITGCLVFQRGHRNSMQRLWQSRVVARDVVTAAAKNQSQNGGYGSCSPLPSV